MPVTTYVVPSTKIVHETKVDFSYRSVHRPIHIVQYDKELPIVAVSLYVSGKPYTIPEEFNVNVRMGKRDKTFVSKPVLGCNTERNVVYFEMDEQMTYFNGPVNPILELTYYDGSNLQKAGSSAIAMTIERNPIQESDIQSNSVYVDLLEVIEDAMQNIEVGSDVLEYINFSSFPSTGESGKIYISQDTNKTYRWSGNGYVEINASLDITELEGKVDKIEGKGLSENDLTDTLKSNYDTAYTHSQTTHAPSNAQKNSDITKTEIEAKLTGEITSHSHALPNHTHTKSEISDFPTSIAPEEHTHTKSDIIDFPTTMTPEEHTHTKSEITDFPTSMPPTAHTHTKSEISDFPTSMPPTSHNHDDRYYTETEVDTKLAGKATAAHDHNDIYYTETEIDTKLGGKADSTHTHTKEEITDFPTSMPPTEHDHNDIYYTETEIDTKLGGKANAAHDHTISEITDFPTSMPPTAHNHDSDYYKKIETYDKSEVDQLVSEIPNKQDKLVAGDNITINEETNEIGVSGVVKSINGQTPNASGLVQFSYAALNNKPDLFSGNYNDLINKPDIPDVSDAVTLTGEQTISGAKTFSNQIRRTNVGNAAGLLIEGTGASLGTSPNMIRSEILKARAINSNEKIATMFTIGWYGREDFGEVPQPHYMYLDSRSNGNYDTATLKVDAENRVGVAIGTSRPIEALDVGGKIMMRTQTVAGDNDNIVVTKGYMDAAINTLNHDIVLIPDTAFTITQAHFNKTLIITSSSDVTITVPTKIVEDIEKGFFCDIVRYGTGEVTFSGAGIVLNSAGPLSIDAQYIASSLIKIDDNNEWLLIGGRE